MTELEKHAAQVAAFGGRISAEDEVSLLEELDNSQLGQVKELPTGAPLGALFPPNLTLAEMRVSRPIRVDLSFQFLNSIPAFVGGLSTAQNPIQPGDGFLRITWGTPGAVKNMVEVDSGHGWRYSFTCSYLRLEYVTFDPNGLNPIISGQRENLLLQGMISPAAEAPVTPLVRTVLYNTPLAVLTTGEERAIPGFAESLMLECITGNVGMQFAIEFFNLVSGSPGANLVDRTFIGASANNTPLWVPKQLWKTVPQEARIARVRNFSAGFELLEYRLKYRLAL